MYWHVAFSQINVSVLNGNIGTGEYFVNKVMWYRFDCLLIYIGICFTPHLKHKSWLQ